MGGNEQSQAWYCSCHRGFKSRTVEACMAVEEPGQLEEREESQSLRLAKSRLGRRAQVGGGLAVFIGLIWLMFVSPAPPGALVDWHRGGLAFLAVGIFGLAIGTFGRWY
jgi:hypothetical protein